MANDKYHKGGVGNIREGNEGLLGEDVSMGGNTTLSSYYRYTYVGVLFVFSGIYFRIYMNNNPYSTSSATTPTHKVDPLSSMRAEPRNSDYTPHDWNGNRKTHDPAAG